MNATQKLIAEGFGERLQLARFMRGMTQEELARILREHHDPRVAGNSRSISEWEHGKRVPYARTIKALAQILDVPFEWLILGVESGATPEEKWQKSTQPLTQ